MTVQSRGRNHTHLVVSFIVSFKKTNHKLTGFLCASFFSTNILGISRKVCQDIAKVGLSSDLNFTEPCFHAAGRENKW